MSDPFQVLGVSRDATPEAVKAAYRRRAQETHPDREGGSVEAFQTVRAAYDVLSDPEKRARLSASSTGFVTPGNLQASTLEYINAVALMPDVDGVCSTCGGAKKVRVAIGKIAYRVMDCPKCGDK